MNGRNDNELQRLLGEFHDSKKAADWLEDSDWADEAITSHPAPQPRDELIAQIKAQTARQLIRYKRLTLLKKSLYAAAAVAAVVAVVAGIELGFFTSSKPTPTEVLPMASTIPTAIWESDNLQRDDEELAFFAAQIEQIEDELVDIQTDRSTAVGDTEVSELEMELIEIEDDFWKE